MRCTAVFSFSALALCLLLSLAACAGSRPQVMPDGRQGGYRLTKTWRPSLFQGGFRRHDYYEGWYFKCVSADAQVRFALIPGIALGPKGDTCEAFIQYIDGTTGATAWHSFPMDAFSYSQREFAVRIGQNYFSGDSVHADLGAGAGRVQVDLRMRGQHPWRVRALAPGIMGWYRFVPGMETCHGLVSWDHRLDGRIVVGTSETQLEAGRGYIEKDWGSSFPRSYIWMQTNHFPADSASFMCSIATIPYLGKHFAGFLGFLWANGRLYRFATYTHARIRDLRVDHDHVAFEVLEGKWVLSVAAQRTTHGVLMAPTAGQMQRRISESIDATVALTLRDRDGALIWQGTGAAAGLEMVGDMAELGAQQ